MGKLRKTAKAVELGAGDCAKIISGTLYQKLSTQERPVFKFICRSPERKSFSLLLDGLSMEVVDADNPGVTKSFAMLKQERRQREEIERLRKENERQFKFWELCQQELKRRTVNMRELEWLTTEWPAADISTTGRVRYKVDFDAKDFKGLSLHYRGECDYASGNDFEVRIRPRR